MQGAKPKYNGRIQVDVGPATHRKIGARARKEGVSMSQVVRKAVREMLARKESA